MTSLPVVAAVDWGTTRMRVWLLDAAGSVLAERRSDDCMLSAGAIGFEHVLERHLGDMQASASLPVIICGMAGARQGWVEAPYVAAPAAMSDVLSGAIRIAGLRRDVRIVPGVAQYDAARPDVMRGEETQLAGLRLTETSLVCMPGTHSKWVRVELGRIASFGTWMTGEVFSVLSQNSVLRHSLAESDVGQPAHAQIFADAVAVALDDPGGLTGQLFGIRAASLLKGLSPDDARARLSGLLIGCEIASAKTRFAQNAGPVILVGSGCLADLYDSALRLAGFEPTRADADAAVRAGLFEAAKNCQMVPSQG